MKSVTSFALLSAFATFAASAAVTTPVGYETIDLDNTIEYHLLGLRLHKPIVVSGEISGLSGTVVSDSAVDFDATLTGGTTYIMEITSGALAGAIQEVSTWGTGSGNTVNDFVTVVDLGSMGVVATDTYVLRAAPTIEEVFDTTALTPGFVSGQADLLWVPDGAGDYTKYYLSSLAGNPVRDAATNTNAPNVPLIYQDGLIVQKRAANAATSVVVTGEVKLTGTLTPVLGGTAVAPSFNVISTVYPAGSTLANAGIKDNMLTGFVSGQADLLWVPDGAGGYTKYFVSSLAPNNWKDAATNTDVADPTLVELPSAVLIERKDVAVNHGITPPAFYSTL